MQDLTPTEQQTNTPAPKQEKKRRVPKAIAQAIELLVTGACTQQKAAAERVGITPEHLSRMLSRDYIRVFCERRARQTIAAGAMRASRRLVELVDAGSEHVSLDATKHMLGIAGIAPAPNPSVSVNIELKAGYVIDLSEETARARVSVANPVIENTQLLETSKQDCPKTGLNTDSQA